MKDYGVPFFIAFCISSPISVPLSLYGFGVPLPFDMSIFTILLSYLWILMKGKE